VGGHAHPEKSNYHQGLSLSSLPLKKAYMTFFLVKFNGFYPVSNKKSSIGSVKMRRVYDLHPSKFAFRLRPLSNAGSGSDEEEAQWYSCSGL
jgi:hypothetical protein